MQRAIKPPVAPTSKKQSRLMGVAVFSAGLLAFLGVLTYAGTQLVLRERVVTFTDDRTPPATSTTTAIAPFPIGVDPKEEAIVENPDVDVFFNETVDTGTLARRSRTTWVGRILGKLSQIGLYQNIASPTGRILVIQSGERKEQVANNFTKILKWDTAQKNEFLSYVSSSTVGVTDGTLMPSTYIVDRNALPAEVAQEIDHRFSTEVRARYTEDVEEQVPLKDALIIASLLEREAYDFEDMRHISGVIWNRLFADMNLQLDASLQYAKANKGGTAWWPRVVPNDKYIKSPYNTYANPGLPPGPISNVSLDAILAALNPKKTDCMYYFHDKKGGFHCSVTYEEHVANLKKIYGRGK